MDQESGLPGEVHPDTEENQEAIERLENHIEQLSEMMQIITNTMFEVHRDSEVMKRMVRQELIRLRQTLKPQSYL